MIMYSYKMIHLLHRADQRFAIDAAAADNITAARSVFDSLDWSEDNYRMLERVGQTGQHVHTCFSSIDQVSKQAITTHFQ